MPNISSKTKFIFIAAALIIVVIITASILNKQESKPEITQNLSGLAQNIFKNNPSSKFSRYNLTTDTSKSLIDLQQVLSGGPGKDGIPSIDSPKFVSVSEAGEFVKDEFLGIFLELDGEQRFYPNNILVWHEIVNDKIGANQIAITFCPLCGSAIVFDRNVEGKTLDFGVSGLLYQSNLLMFDRKTESLWSQIEGRAVIGELTGTDLKIIDSQLISFLDIKTKFPRAKVLSTNTGANRNYNRYPYGDYEMQNDEFYFPVAYKGQDINIQSKTIMYASTINKTPVAFAFLNLKDTGRAKIKVEGLEITAEFKEGQVSITDESGNTYPGYFTMWFSWANHNLSAGVNKEQNGIFWIKD